MSDAATEPAPELEVVTDAPTQPNLMEAWLQRDLFDELPEGIPPMDEEDDDE